jgi:hypothetical protein
MLTAVSSTSFSFSHDKQLSSFSRVCVSKTINNKPTTQNGWLFLLALIFIQPKKCPYVWEEEENSRIYFVMYYPSIHRARERENG